MDRMIEVLHAQDLKNPEWTSVIMSVLSHSVPSHVSLAILDVTMDEHVRPYIVDIAIEVINTWNEQNGIEDRWAIIDGNLWKSGPGDSIVRPESTEAADIVPENYNEEYIKRLIDSVEDEGETV